MSMKGFGLLLSLIIGLNFLTGCFSKEHSESNKFTFDDFPEKKQLTGKKYVFPEILVPSRILYKNGKLIVSDRSGLAILHRINAKKMSYEQEKAKIGWGPNELPSVWSIDSGVSNDTFWVYSSSGKLFAEFDLADSTKSFKSSLKQTEKMYLATQLTITENNSFFGFMINGEDQFVLFDSLGNIKSRFGKWSEVMPELSYDPYLIADLHYGDLIGNSNQGIFALPSIRTDRIEIIDLNKQTKKVVEGPVNHFPEYKIINSGGEEVIVVDSFKEMLTYNTGFVGGEMIFLAFIGKNRAKMGNDNVKDILVLDFDGKPVVHYVLDQSVLNITVDEVNRKIYGTTIDEEPGILVFDY